MSKPVRKLHGFFEAEGPYAINRGFAETIYDVSAGIVGRYTGPIALQSVKGVRIPTEANPIRLTGVRLGSADHTGLLTKRGIHGEGLAKPDGFEDGEFGGLTQYRVDGTRVVSSKFLANVLPPTLDATGGIVIKRAVHEMGHSFGLDHCRLGACIMHAGHDSVMNAVDPILASGKPFCDNCAGDLEVAGYQALAAEL